MKMPEPNMDAIRDIAQRAEEAFESGRMDRNAWRAFLSEAYADSNGRPDLTAFLAPYAKSEWVDELRAEDSTHRRSVAGGSLRRGEGDEHAHAHGELQFLDAQTRGAPDLEECQAALLRQLA